MKDTVLVTGATGRVGGAVARMLVERGHAVRALVRDPDTLRLPVEAARGDLTDPASVERALEGVGAVFLYAQGDRAEELSRALQRSAVEKVVVLSTIDATSDRPYAQHNRRRHLAFEQAAAAAVPRSTMLRPGAFAANALRFWRTSIAGGAVRVPFPAAKQAPIDELDIAAVAVQALTSDALDGRAVVLTGPESLSQREQVACLGEALGRQIWIEHVSPDEARTDLARIVPPAYVDLMLAQWADETEHAATVTDEVAVITGRPATSYARWAQRNREKFAP